MNPDKLFNYLDGKLPSNERAVIEQQLLTDVQLQREMNIARQIHARIGDNPNASSEVILAPEETGRAGVLGRRIAVGFSVLVALNVGFGLLFIAHREGAKPTVPQGAAAKNDQIRQWAESAGARALPAPTLREYDLTMVVPRETIPVITRTITDASTQFNGSATNAPPGVDGEVLVIADLPTERLDEFSHSLASSGFSVSDLQQIPHSNQPRQIVRILLKPVASR